MLLKLAKALTSKAAKRGADDLVELDELPPAPASEVQPDTVVVARGELDLLIRGLEEQTNYRREAASDFIKLFEALNGISLGVDGKTLNRLSRLAGTTLLEAAYILKSAQETEHIDGDWCEYGVAHGRTSALLGEVMLKGRKRTLWLYDSFEGLPAPHQKDVMLHDFYGKGSMAAYQGMFSFSEDMVRAELATVAPETDWFKTIKGWITSESLKAASPKAVALAYLDMDFYQSTIDVLNALIPRMPKGGIAVVDDYGVFSEGVKTAVSEIMISHPGAFSLENPFNSKFAVMKRL